MAIEAWTLDCDEQIAASDIAAVSGYPCYLGIVASKFRSDGACRD
jgi:hypothetical protein